MEHTADNNVMHAKPGLRVFLKWKIYRPGSVITAVIRLKLKTDENTHCHFLLAAVCACVVHDQWPAYFDDVGRKFRI